MEPTPWLRNRRTGVILPYNPHLATHPDMEACEELPYPKEVKKPTTPTHRRYLASLAEKAEAAKAEEKTKPQTRKTTKAESKPEGSGSAEIDDLLAGIEHG